MVFFYENVVLLFLYEWCCFQHFNRILLFTMFVTYYHMIYHMHSVMAVAVKA